MNLRHWLDEARRRRVFRTTAVYLVAVWGISQGVVEIAPLFGAPDWLLRATLVGAVAVLPVVVLLAWRFDIGRRGIVRDPRDIAPRADDDPSEAPTLLGPDPRAGTLRVTWDDDSGSRSIDFVDAFTIGRGSDCLVRVEDPLVSRRHARVTHENGQWRIRDLGSRFGTRVDDERIDVQLIDDAVEIRVNLAGPLLRLEQLEAATQTLASLAWEERPEAAIVRPPGSDRGTSLSATDTH